MKGRLLITGASGYVASHLIPMLRRHRPNVELIATSRRQPAKRLQKLIDRHYKADLTDRGDVLRLIQGVQPDTVIHLAAQRSGSLESLLHVNAVATAYLLEATRERMGGKTRLLIVGSSAELGRCDPGSLPLSERTLPQPIDAYGISKLAQAVLAHAAYLRYGQDVVRVRLFNLIGPGLPESLLPGRCVRLLAAVARREHQSILRFGDLSTKRDYIDIRDACHALLAALKQGQTGQLYHIGSGKALSGREIVKQILKHAEPITGQIDFQEEASHSSAVPIQIADSNLALNDLSWTPKISLKESIRDMWESALEDRPDESINISSR